MRHDLKSGSLSVYDVYHLLKPKVDIRNIGHNLRGKPKFTAFLSKTTSVLFPLAKGSNQSNTSTPALHSRESLNSFLLALRAGLKGPELADFRLNTEKFRTDHAEFLDQLWPKVDQQTPTSPVLDSQDNRRPMHEPHEIPSEHAIEKIEQSFQPPLSFKPETVNGIYTTTCPTEKVPTLLRVVGMYTHTHWVNKGYTPKSNDGEARNRVRYKCFRGSNAKKSSRTRTPCASTQQQQQPLGASSASAPVSPASTQQHPLSASVSSAIHPPTSTLPSGGKIKKVERNGGRTLKCECPAYITGSYAPSDAEVTLTLDLRHYKHSPETQQDGLHLPLLPEVRQKLDTLTIVIREYSLLKRQLKVWLKSKFLPQAYPHFDVDHIILKPLDGRFRPSNDEIKMSIRRANQNLRLSPVDQESTFRYLNKQKVTYMFRPSLGAPLAYTCSPAHGLRASRVDTRWRVHHTSQALCEASSPDLMERAMYLYEMHNVCAAPPVKDEAPKSATGTIRYNSLHAHKIK